MTLQLNLSISENSTIKVMSNSKDIVIKRVGGGNSKYDEFGIVDITNLRFVKINFVMTWSYDLVT